MAGNKSIWINISGSIYWANSKYGGLFDIDPKYDVYKARVYPDAEGWEKFKKAGLQLKTKTDENGDYVEFKRRPIEVRKGKVTEKGRPKVFFSNGIEPTRDIGNGSKCIVNVNVYDTQQGVGHRLEEVTITDLLPINREGGGNIMDRKELTDEDVPSEMGGEEAEETVDDDVPFDGGTKELNDKIPFGDEPKKAPVKKNPFRR